MASLITKIGLMQVEEYKSAAGCGICAELSFKEPIVFLDNPHFYMICLRLIMN